MATVTKPTIRTRVNYTQSARGEIRWSEITVEVTDHPDPVGETARLYHELKAQADRDTQQMTPPARLTNTNGARP